ncbi:MAG: L,D-transpeptidase family protein [Fusobacteriaceae bacterium]
MNKLIILAFCLVYLTGYSSVADENNIKNMSSVSDIQFNTLEIYDHKIPENINYIQKYEENQKLYNYVFLKTAIGNIRELPSTKSKIITTGKFMDRFKVFERVGHKNDQWYKVQLSDGREGFISKEISSYRSFRFNQALDRIHSTLEFIKSGEESSQRLAVTDTYRPDPNNKSNKRDKDKYGNTEDQSLLATNSKGEKVFIPDRSLVKVLEKNGNKAKIQVSSIPEESLLVDNRKLSFKKNITSDGVNKSIVIDVPNQNMMLFEKIGGEWNLISYVYSKTGLTSTLGYETPKGNFLAAVTKTRMYFNDGLGNEQGYAKDATRFSGGGYVHSTPLDNKEQEKREFYLAQKERSLGTFPGTRKCVRTTESHAKFIRQWIMGNNYNPKLWEQNIQDNVLFVIM